MLTTDRKLDRRPAQKLQQYHFNFGFPFLFSSIHVLFVSTGTDCCSLEVLTFMEPKLDCVYARGLSKSVAPSDRLVIGSNDECDPEYVPLGSVTPARATRTTRATPTKVAPNVVTAS